MGIRKDIKDIKEKVEFITNETINKAKKYDQLVELLSKIKFKTEHTDFFLDEYGKIGINVKYKINPIKIQFDDNNDVIKNETFYAINFLDLVPLEEQMIVMKKIEEAKNKNNF